MTCNIPQEYGGGGLSHVDTVIISEELAYWETDCFFQRVAFKIAQMDAEINWANQKITRLAHRNNAYLFVMCKGL